MRQVAKGDQTALKEVFELTNSKLFGICLRISKDREIAEDVLQEVYIKIWRRAGRFDRDKSSPITWLSTIARNSAIDAMRRKVLPSVTDDILSDFPDRAPLSDKLIEDAQMRARIEDCIDELDSRHQDCIQRAFFDGLSYSQVAKQVDTPLNTIKGWMRRAFLSLRECLDA
nr:sigma-70 family RNA polymerase sigma factor [Sphingomicrobium sediminis]